MMPGTAYPTGTSAGWQGLIILDRMDGLLVAILTNCGILHSIVNKARGIGSPRRSLKNWDQLKRTFYVSKIGSTGFFSGDGRRSGGVGVGCNRMESNLMTVAELIAILQTMPQDAPVAVNDFRRGNFYETVDGVDHFDADWSPGDPEVVVIQVGEV